MIDVDSTPPRNLLPRGKQWWVLLALLPLSLLLVDPLRHPAGPYDLALSVAALLVFLALFGWSVLQWDSGRTGPWQFAGMVLITLAFAPFNSMAWLLFLTVICLTSWVADGKVFGTVLLVAAILGLLTLETWLLDMPWLLAKSVAIYAVPDAVVSFILRKQVHDVAKLTRAEERNRIARDMHDVLGHTLSVIVLKAELAQRLVQANPQRATTELRDIELTARALLQQVRDTLSGYRSSDLQQEFDQSRSTLQTAGLQVKLDYHNVALPTQYKTVLSLALREAVTNIVRHAKAQSGRLALTQNGNTVQLTVADDGHWQAGTSEGNGLRGMRERVAMLGGTLQLTHDAGTQLCITLPYAAGKEANA